MSSSNPIPSDIGEYLAYDPLTGVVSWVVDQGWWAKKGKPVGSVKWNKAKTYCQLTMRFRQKYYKLHRIAYFLHTGEQPPCPNKTGMTIHHIDGDATNNRWENLEVVTRVENCQSKNTVKKPKYISYCKRDNAWVVQKKTYGVLTKRNFKDRADAEAFLATLQE